MSQEQIKAAIAAGMLTEHVPEIPTVAINPAAAGVPAGNVSDTVDA